MGLHVACGEANNVVASVKIAAEHGGGGKQFGELVGDGWENAGGISKV